MRKILIIGLAVAGIGLAWTSGASALPVNGAVIGDLATATDHVTTVQHWRWGSDGGHWRWGSRADIGDGAVEVATGAGAAADEGGELAKLTTTQAAVPPRQRSRRLSRKPL